MPCTPEQLAETGSNEILEISLASGVINAAYSAVRFAGDTLKSKLEAQGLDLPDNPVAVDIKRYYGLTHDIDPQVELRMAWHGYRTFWVPNDPDYDRRRQRPCFRRLQSLAPELVEFIDSRMPERAAQDKNYRPDRLSISLPLVASMDLLSSYLIGPRDPGVYTAGELPRHNYLV